MTIREAKLPRTKGDTMPYKSAASSPTPELTPSVRAQLLDARVWQPILEKYTTAVNLAVTWIDRDKHWGPIVTARPTWSLVSATVPSSTDDCGFSLFSPQTCNCVADAFKKGDIVLVRDRVRLTHFAIPLVLNEQRVSTLRGQVFDQYPDQLALGHIAHTAGISSEEIWKVARLEHPVKRATLQVYADLLWVLGENILQAQHQKLMEDSRLAELTQLREDLQTRVEELEKFEAAVVGRELKMIELERELEGLKRPDRPTS